MADENLEKLIDYAISRKIPYLTMWVFSTENWKRSKIEVAALMNIFRQTFTTMVESLDKKGVKIYQIGDLTRFDQDIQEKVTSAIERTINNKKITVTFAMNYGGRDEILRTFNKLLKEGKKSVSEDDFTQALDTSGLPEPDLIIRTGGEQRLSGFLPWQGVYSELYFTKTLLPDFNEQQFDLALEEFGNRQRRYGK
jgi:undecaprenyl diphosphate synthase